MARMRRPLAGLLWIGVLLFIGRIVSGGAVSIGSIRYAIGTLPVVVSGWLLVTLVGGIAILAAIIVDRPWARASFALAAATIPLGAVLAALGHDSALAASAVAAAIVAASRWRVNPHVARDEAAIDHEDMDRLVAGQ